MKKGDNMAGNHQNKRQLSRRELENVKEKLLSKKRELWHAISEDIREDASAEYQELLQTISKDPGDKAMAELRESTIYSYVELKAKELESIEEALIRIESGEYGRCRDCGKWIRPARLEVMPYAVRCRACQENWEKISNAV
jgi:DnaK suppressor protein